MTMRDRLLVYANLYLTLDTEVKRLLKHVREHVTSIHDAQLLHSFLTNDFSLQTDGARFEKFVVKYHCNLEFYHDLLEQIRLHERDIEDVKAHFVSIGLKNIIFSSRSVSAIGTYGVQVWYDILSHDLSLGLADEQVLTTDVRRYMDTLRSLFDDILHRDIF